MRIHVIQSTASRRRVSLIGIDLLTIEARVVVASIETYLSYAGTVSGLPAAKAIR